MLVNFVPIAMAKLFYALKLTPTEHEVVESRRTQAEFKDAMRALFLEKDYLLRNFRNEHKALKAAYTGKNVDACMYVRGYHKATIRCPNAS